mmetsp:Transcript_14845/g.42791  ORF Transcript_14845/g.42791 Transcript_14845/m.42791 type:complete len:220 (+) Transcript_14845:1727-2386(+)
MLDPDFAQDDAEEAQEDDDQQQVRIFGDVHRQHRSCRALLMQQSRRQVRRVTSHAELLGELGQPHGLVHRVHGGPRDHRRCGRVVVRRHGEPLAPGRSRRLGGGAFVHNLPHRDSAPRSTRGGNCCCDLRRRHVEPRPEGGRGSPARQSRGGGRHQHDRDRRRPRSAGLRPARPQHRLCPSKGKGRKRCCRRHHTPRRSSDLIPRSRRGCAKPCGAGTR